MSAPALAIDSLCKTFGALRATDAGRLMVAHYVRLGTMRAIVGQGSHRSAPDLLGVISRAEEVVGAVVLRRCERWL